MMTLHQITTHYVLIMMRCSPIETKIKEDMYESHGDSLFCAGIKFGRTGFEFVSTGKCCASNSISGETNSNPVHPNSIPNQILSPCNYYYHPWCVGDKSCHKALFIMFRCDGMSDHDSWNEVFHYGDTEFSCVETHSNPVGRTWFLCRKVSLCGFRTCLTLIPYYTDKCDMKPAFITDMGILKKNHITRWQV